MCSLEIIVESVRSHFSYWIKEYRTLFYLHCSFPHYCHFPHYIIKGLHPSSCTCYNCFHWLRKMTKSHQRFYLCCHCQILLICPIYNCRLHVYLSRRTNLSPCAETVYWFTSPLLYFVSFLKLGTVFPPRVYNSRTQHGFQMILGTCGIFVWSLLRRQLIKLIGMKSVWYKLKIEKDERRP